MTEPLRVDTDGLDAASTILKTAAGEIPAPPPKLSVSGTDPLSLAIARGAAQVEAPMAALPGIRANAISVAEKIGVAGQRYRSTDEMLAEKTRQHMLDHDDALKQGTADPNATARGGGIGKYKASPLLGKDLPTLPDDPSGPKSNGAPTPPEIHAGPGVRESKQGFWDNWFTNKDFAASVADTAIGAKADIPKYMVEQAMKGPASGAPPSWVTTAFSDIKGLKGVSRAGGALAAPFLVWHIADDMREDGNSIYQATAREGGGFLAGAAAGRAMRRD